MKKNKSKKPIYKRVWFWIVAFFVLVVIAGAFGDDSNSNGSSSSSSSSQVSKKSSSKKEIKKKSTNSDSKVNKDLAKGLSQAQGWANGTLDENGSSTDNGSSNDEYAWANYIDKITYDRSSNIKIYVNSLFQVIDDSEKTDIISNASNDARISLYQDGKISEDELSDPLYVSIYYGNRGIGHSKLSDHSEYKFYE